MAKLEELRAAIRTADAAEKAAFAAVERAEHAFEDACTAFAAARDKADSARAALYEEVAKGTEEIDPVRSQRYAMIARNRVHRHGA